MTDLGCAGRKLLTVAVPAYNAAEYLPKCLTSFICPQMDALEVIVINDGSSDDTLQIAQQFAHAYPQVFRLIDKENGGHGSGINQAAKAATGDYFRVVDADDWVLTDNLPVYLDALSKTSADVVLTHFHTVDKQSGQRVPYRNEGLLYDVDHPIEALLPCIDRASKWFCIHSLSYRTEFYQKLTLQLSENIFYEDTEYAVLPFADVQSIRLVDVFIYEYLIGNASQSVSIANYCKRYHHIEQVLLRLARQYEHRRGERLITAEFLRRRICMLLGTYEKVMLIYLPARSTGRAATNSMLQTLEAIDPLLKKANRTRYGLLLLLHYLRVSPDQLESLYQRMKRKGNH